MINFDGTDLLNSKLFCQMPASQTTKNEYIGNRGINLIRDNKYTTYSSLSSAIPSTNAISSWLDEARFNDNQTVDVTIWLNGFFTPLKTSIYLFSILTNGPALLYLSNDTTSANKVINSTQN